MATFLRVAIFFSLSLILLVFWRVIILVGIFTVTIGLVQSSATLKEEEYRHDEQGDIHEGCGECHCDGHVEAPCSEQEHSKSN